MAKTVAAVVDTQMRRDVALRASRASRVTVAAAQGLVVLLLAEFLNTGSCFWTHQRVVAARDSLESHCQDYEGATGWAKDPPDGDYARVRDMPGCASLKSHVEELEKREVPRLDVPTLIIPLFVDVNWLCVLSGLGSIVLLLWLRGALIREKTTLERLLAAKDHEGLANVRAGWLFHHTAVKVTVISLWVALLLIFCNDIASFDRGWSVSHPLTILVLVGGFLTLAFSGYAGYLVVRSVGDVEAVGQDAANGHAISQQGEAG